VLCNVFLVCSAELCCRMVNPGWSALDGQPGRWVTEQAVHLAGGVNQVSQRSVTGQSKILAPLSAACAVSVVYADRLWLMFQRISAASTACSGAGGRECINRSVCRI
jgi:hypothetical protein